MVASESVVPIPKRVSMISISISISSRIASNGDDAWASCQRRGLRSRARLERLGIVDAEGKLVSTELPPEMLPRSDTTLETG